MRPRLNVYLDRLYFPSCLAPAASPISRIAFTNGFPLDVPILSKAHVQTLCSRGTANGFGGKVDDEETFFAFSSFNSPTAISRLNLETGEVSAFKTPDVAMNPDDYVVKQVFYKSKDGTRIAMFIAHREDVVPDGNTPTMLYGYGGFNISVTVQPANDMLRRRLRLLGERKSPAASLAAPNLVSHT